MIPRFRAWIQTLDGDIRGPFFGGFSIHATGTVVDRVLLPDGKILVEMETDTAARGGKKIYEGDMCRNPSEPLDHPRQVTWFCNSFCWGGVAMASLDHDLEIVGIRPFKFE